MLPISKLMSNFGIEDSNSEIERNRNSIGELNYREADLVVGINRRTIFFIKPIII